jgi:hypothetical protein
MRLHTELQNEMVLKRLMNARASSQAIQSFYIAPIHESDPSLQTAHPLPLKDAIREVLKRCLQHDPEFPTPIHTIAPQGRDRYIFEIGAVRVLRENC